MACGRLLCPHQVHHIVLAHALRPRAGCSRGVGASGRAAVQRVRAAPCQGHTRPILRGPPRCYAPVAVTSGDASPCRAGRHAVAGGLADAKPAGRPRPRGPGGPGGVVAGRLALASAHARRRLRPHAAPGRGPRAGAVALALPRRAARGVREARLAVRDNQSGLVSVSEKLRQLTGAEHIPITLGGEGVFLHRTVVAEGEWTDDQVPALNPNPIDVAGAGDAFLVSAALALATGTNIWGAMFIGSLASACQVERTGNIPITRAELLRKLKS